MGALRRLRPRRDGARHDRRHFAVRPARVISLAGASTTATLQTGARSLHDGKPGALQLALMREPSDVAAWLSDGRALGRLARADVASGVIEALAGDPGPDLAERP